MTWRLSEDVVVKFWPDTVIFYACLELAVLVAGVGAEFLAVRTAAAKIAVNGQASSFSSLVLFITPFVEYWMHDHAFHGGKFNDYVLKKPARTAGLVASAFMGLLLLPVSKRSSVLTAIGLSWESTLWMHIALVVLFLFSACLHVSPMAVLPRFARGITGGMTAPAQVAPAMCQRRPSLRRQRQ